MALESFYGGKQGLSSVIKKTFKYISENDPAYLALDSDKQQEAINNEEVMDKCLQNADYKDVWYGELCLIDTVNKNNPANGRLYRRTLKNQGSKDPANTQETLSAEYIGQIVGPASGTPFMQFTSLAGVDAAAAKDYGSYSETLYEDSAGNIVHDEQLQDNLEKIDTYKHNALAEDIFIPGTADGDDTIFYNWFNVRKNEEEDTESWVYLGLQIPYLVVENEYVTTDYWKWPDRYNEADGRKFYQKWHIEIPRGVRGNGISDIRLTTYNEEIPEDSDAATLYQNFSVIVHDESTDEYSFDINADKVDGNFLVNQIAGDLDRPTTEEVLDAPIYVCDFTIYNSYDYGATDASGQTVTIYLGMPKDIEDFVLENDGSITIKYQDKSSKTLTNKIRWINDIVINSAIAETNPGQIVINYNTGAADTFNLGLPNKASFDESTGIFTFGTTDDNSYTLKDMTSSEDFQFEYPISASLIGDVTAKNKDEDRKIHYQTNIITDKEHNDYAIGSPINYVQDMIVYLDAVRKPYTGHLLVLFNDPEHRTPHIDSEHTSTTPDLDGITWYKDEEIFGVGGKYGGEVYWRDYGSVIGYGNGLYIGSNLDLIWDEGYSYKDENDEWVTGAYCWINPQNSEDKIYFHGEVTSKKIISSILNEKEPYKNGLDIETLIGLDGIRNNLGMLVTATLKKNESSAADEDDELDLTYYFAYDYNYKSNGEHVGWTFINVSSTDFGSKLDIMVDGFNYFGYTLDIMGSHFKALEIEDNIDKANALAAPWIINGSYSIE